MRRRLPILAATIVAALGAASCGDEDDEGSPAQPQSPEQQAETAEKAQADPKDTSQKPVVEVPPGSPPRRLQKEEIVKGEGRAAKDGDTLTMQYVGVSFSTGEQFDASWDRGEPFTFQLGAGQVIPGWDRGIKGMRKGGRRRLIIPPELAYGSTGQGPIGPNETLIFVVDVVGIS